MRSRTLVAVLFLSLTFILIIAFGVIQLSNGGGTLTEEWVSDTVRDHEGNHHAVRPLETSEGISLIAPINDVGDEESMSRTSCALVRLDGESGAVEWETGMDPQHCHIHTFSDPETDDIDGDGDQEILIGTGKRALIVYDSSDGSKEWEHEFDTIGYSKPAVANVTSSPGKEIVAVDLQGGVSVIRANGTTAWEHNLSETVWADPIVDDFSGDGAPEIAVGSRDGVTVFDANGTVLWRTNETAYNMIAGDTNGDDRNELFIADRFSEEHSVQALDSETGESRWTWTTDREPAVHAFGDGDADGTSELYVGVEGGEIVALDATDGSVDWETEVAVSGNEIVPPPSLGDVNGDDDPDLVAVTADGLVTVIDPATGDQLASYEREVPLWIHPTLVDIDSDGSDEIIVIYGDGRVVALSYSE